MITHDLQYDHRGQSYRFFSVLKISYLQFFVCYIIINSEKYMLYLNCDVQIFMLNTCYKYMDSM